MTLLYPNVGDLFNNKLINISWEATDLDGNNLNYAVILSPDNGTNWNTLDFDFNATNYSINTLDLMDGKDYLVKVLATDGFNTNYTISDAFGIDNDLNITELKVVYQNNTERVFKIGLNNTLNTAIGNITWEFNTGESVVASQYLFDLEPKEEIFIFVYHNYTLSGIYNLSFKAQNGFFIETDSKNITI